MELFYESNGHKYRVLTMNRLGQPDVVDELQDAQFEDLPTEETKEPEAPEFEHVGQIIDLTI